MMTTTKESPIVSGATRTLLYGTATCGKCLDTLVIETDAEAQILHNSVCLTCGNGTRRVTTRERVPLHLIDPNPWQPREQIDDEAVEDMAASILQVDVQQAPLARVVRGRIELAFGHTRCEGRRRNSQRGVGPDWIEVDIKDLSDQEMYTHAISENVRRQNLNPLEVARSQRRAVDELGFTLAEVAEQFLVSPSTVSNNLRVLELPQYIVEHVESGDLTLSVAREFLALQCTGDHVHDDDMKMVLGRITRGDGPPDWRRRTVRKLISEAVSYNEKDWRPIGPPTNSSTGGGKKEAGFDTDAFGIEYPKSLHTIPATVATNLYGGQDPAYEKSRIWTCEAREWSRWQSRATREANREADAGNGVSREKGGRTAAKPTKNQDFEKALAKDPVFLKIKKGRTTTKKDSPNRPVTEEERAALGTRAELRNLHPYGDKEFWRTLENDVPENIRDWGSHKAGSKVPPFFNLSECRGCVAGRAYGRVNGNYHYRTGLQGIIPVCVNRQCYDAKLSRDTAAHQDKVEAQLIAQNREDDHLVRTIMAGLTPLSAADLRIVAVSLVAAGPVLELHHTMGGIPHQKWSYKTTIMLYLTGQMEHQPATFERYDPRGNGKVTLVPDSVDDVPDDQMLELVASLMVHHLRIAGRAEVGTPDDAAASTDGHQQPIPEDAYELVGA